MQDNLPPIFVKANLKFSMLGRDYSFPNEGVSVFGATGLRTPAFNPVDLVGTAVPTIVEILATKTFAFHTTASMTAEITVDNTYLGLKFSLPDDVKRRVSELVRTEGYYPTNYVRKYPRIPARDVIPSMPLRAIAQNATDDLIAFDIANMSPGGILLHTENPKASLLVPSMRFEGQVEPRGSSEASFQFDGLVCRMMIEMNPTTRNTRRYLGVRFTRIPDEQRPQFLEILKMVLINIQQAGLAG